MDGKAELPAGQVGQGLARDRAGHRLQLGVDAVHEVGAHQEGGREAGEDERRADQGAHDRHEAGPQRNRLELAHDAGNGPAVACAVWECRAHQAWGGIRST